MNKLEIQLYRNRVANEVLSVWIDENHRVSPKLKLKFMARGMVIAQRLRDGRDKQLEESIVRHGNITAFCEQLEKGV